MADVEDVVPCRLRWHIFNPFVPWRRMVATFYNGSPTLTRWQVTIDPILFNNNIWLFKFSLHNIKSGEPNDVTVADEVRVYISINISINGRPMAEERPFGYTFSSTNRYTYELRTNVLHFPLRDRQHHLLIEVQLSFPNQNLVDQGNEPLLVCDDKDLQQLSEDMRRLYFYPQHSSLYLESKTPLHIFRAHSCILHARWCNFFENHPVERMVNDRVEMNISPAILSAVLLYMYSGLIDTNGPHWGNIHYRTELFQVIDWYKLHHLYRVFARTADSQMRTTSKHLIINTTDFPLGGFDGQPLIDPAFVWTVNSGSEYALVFKIQFYLRAGAPWFSYSLCSDSPTRRKRIYAQVYLEFKRRIVGRPSQIKLLHGHDYTIGSSEPVNSGTCHFPRKRSPAFNDFIAGKLRRRQRRGMQHFIRCVLYLSDGNTVTDIKSEGDRGYQSDLERFCVLSDHMHELLLRPAHSNLRVMCPGETPRDPNIPNDTYFLHKSIFVTRLPEWRAVIQNVLEGNDIPDLAMCDIISEAFRPVHTYIYTGKMPPFPTRYLDDIHDFANRGGLDSLLSLVTQMLFIA